MASEYPGDRRRDVIVVANSGFGNFNSGGQWYDRNRQRRDDFLAAHPSWTIELNRERDAYDAVEKTGNAERLITEKSLGPLMDRLEALYAADDDHQGDRYQEIQVKPDRS